MNLKGGKMKIVIGGSIPWLILIFFLLLSIIIYLLIKSKKWKLIWSTTIVYFLCLIFFNSGYGFVFGLTIFYIGSVIYTLIKKNDN